MSIDDFGHIHISRRNQGAKLLHSNKWVHIEEFVVYKLLCNLMNKKYQ